MTAQQAGADGRARTNEETLVVDAEVIALLPQVKQVLLQDDEGRQYALTRRIDGIDLEALQVGQIVRCVVVRDLGMVLRAEVVS